MGMKTNEMGVRIISKSIGMMLPNARKIHSFMTAKV